MKESQVKDIAIRITGGVQSSNLEEFKAHTMEQLAKINTALVTDDDFAEAEETVKACKLAEIRLANAKQFAITQAQDISDLFDTMDTLRDEVAKVRLKLEKQIKSEKERRKEEVVNNGINEVRSAVSASQVAHGFTINTRAIHDAVKGKKSIKNMISAVSDVVAQELANLRDVENNYTANIEAINSVDASYIGIFPDRNNIALKPSAEVAAIIESRKLAHDLEMERREAAKIAAQKAADAVVVPQAIETPTAPLVEKEPPLPWEVKEKELTATFIFPAEEESKVITFIQSMKYFAGFKK